MDIMPTPEHARAGEGDFFRIKDGSIIFMYARVKGDSVKDYAVMELMRMVSYDEGETWSEPVPVVQPDEIGTTQVCGPSFMRMQNGDLGVFMGGRTTTPMVHKHVLGLSKDEGQTFYEFIDCIPTCYNGVFGLNNDRAVRLQSGRILLPYSIHPGTEKKVQVGKDKPRAGRFTSGHVVYSDDDGRTWKSSEDLIMPPFTDTTKGLQEGGIIELRPGLVKSYWRSDVGHQYTSLSFDDGVHWSVPQRSRFTAPWSPMSIKRNPFTGKLIAIWNPIPLYNGRRFDYYNWGRSPLVYAEVSDDANIIGKLHVLEDKPLHGYCYTNFIFTKPNEMLLGYCFGGEEEQSCLSAIRIAKVTME